MRGLRFLPPAAVAAASSAAADMFLGSLAHNLAGGREGGREGRRGRLFPPREVHFRRTR